VHFHFMAHSGKPYGFITPKALIDQTTLLFH